MLDLFRTLPGFIEGLENNGEAREALVFVAWRKIAGEMLAEHAVPMAFDAGRFVVAVSGRTWQRHLEDLTPQMIFKLNSLLGSAVVRFIEFRIDEKAVKADRHERKKHRAEIAKHRGEAEDQITNDLLEAAAGIADDHLRQAFLMAAGGCMARNQRFAAKK